MGNTFFTSESVTEGHPDKLCDRISDAILDEYLRKDSTARVAIETMCGANFVTVSGEVTSSAEIDATEIVREVFSDVVYAVPTNITVSISQQSPDIALGVDRAGAGDQGMMFGYACRETDSFMPLPIALAHELTNRLTAVRKQGLLPYLKPDGKSQVTVEYAEDGAPIRIDTIVISAQHDADVRIERLREEIIQQVIRIPSVEKWLDEDTKFLVNPTGRFVLGGAEADTGLTGRKIIVDTYGGYARHGGGAFSGKDPTKVDRSAAYAARYVAKNIVGAALAKRCEVQISYAIGVEQPVSIFVETFGTSYISNADLSGLASDYFNLTPKGIMDKFKLRNPIYKDLSSGGHMGRTDLRTARWEYLDMVYSLVGAAHKFRK